MRSDADLFIPHTLSSSLFMVAFDLVVHIRMADASNFVFRWEITTVAIANGKISSEVWNAGGFKWVVTMERLPDLYTDMRVNCSVDHKGTWKCEAEVKAAIYRANQHHNPWPITNNVHSFGKLNASRRLTDNIWAHLTNPLFNNNGTVAMEFCVNIISSTGRMTLFVLRWEIPTTDLVTGKASSQVWNEGGFKWALAIERKVDSYTDFKLECAVDDHCGPWKCEAHVKAVVRGSGIQRTIVNDIYTFTNGITKWNPFIGNFYWSNLLTSNVFNCNGRVTMEVRITIISSSGCNYTIPACPDFSSLDLSKFISPVETSNVSLVIGDNKVVVSKEFLAMHSPVFNKMFFGDFVEKGKKEIEIKEVEYEEFVTLLLVFFPDPIEITDANVSTIAKLADRFEIKGVLNSAEKHLRSSNAFTTAKKLQMADDYRFAKLRDHCLQSYKSAQELRVFEGTEEYNNFSDNMKAAICDRLMKLLNI